MAFAMSGPRPLYHGTTARMRSPLISAETVTLAARHPRVAVRAHSPVAAGLVGEMLAALLTPAQIVGELVASLVDAVADDRFERAAPDGSVDAGAGTPTDHSADGTPAVPLATLTLNHVDEPEVQIVVAGRARGGIVALGDAGVELAPSGALAAVLDRLRALADVLRELVRPAVGLVLTCPDQIVKQLTAFAELVQLLNRRLAGVHGVELAE